MIINLFWQKFCVQIEIFKNGQLYNGYFYIALHVHVLVKLNVSDCIKIAEEYELIFLVFYLNRSFSFNFKFHCDRFFH